jgi:hypothetical protein
VPIGNSMPIMAFIMITIYLFAYQVISLANQRQAIG